jgi:ketosteroid isomerase-like protein
MAGVKKTLKLKEALMKRFNSSILVILALSMFGGISCDEEADSNCGSTTATDTCNCGGDAAISNDQANAQIRTIVESYFQYVNEEKLDEVLALFHPDVELWGPFGFTDQHGIEAVKTFYTFVFDSPIVHKDTPIEFFLKETQAAVAIEGTAGASEDALTTVYAMDWFVFEGDKIKFLSMNLDSSVFMP